MDIVSRLGVHICEGFLVEELRQEIVSEMLQPSEEKDSSTYVDGIPVVDHSIRKAKLVGVSSKNSKRVRQYLRKLCPQVSEVFKSKVYLSDLEKTQYLRYDVGCHHRPHRDMINSTTQRRKVAYVCFLNDPSEDQVDEGYSGGSLILYDVFQSPGLQSHGIKVPAVRGNLCLFDPTVLHEVKAVTSGHRMVFVGFYWQLDKK